MCDVGVTFSLCGDGSTFNVMQFILCRCFFPLSHHEPLLRCSLAPLLRLSMRISRTTMDALSRCNHGGQRREDWIMVPLICCAVRTVSLDGYTNNAREWPHLQPRRPRVSASTRAFNLGNSISCSTQRGLENGSIDLMCG